MQRCLAMYDLSGIQSFIFQTNRLKEIVGASCLVSQALFGNVSALLGEERDAWKERDIDDFMSIPEDAGRTVYIGGGNALVIFGGKESATSFTRKLKRKVFLQTGGALRICSATCMVEETTRLADVLNPAVPNSLRNKLERSKTKAPQPLTARGFSINALDGETSEPVLFFDAALRDRGQMKHFMGRSQHLKLKAYKDQNGTQSKMPASSPLLDLKDGREYKDEFESFFKDDKNTDDEVPTDDDSYCSCGKRFLAVVHIDGNTMGQRITQFLAETKDHCSGFEEDLVAMRDFSAHIGDLYKNTLLRTIDRLYADVEGALPFRPVVADGDDITYICRSEKAFPSVRLFVEELNDAQTADDHVSIPAAQGLSVGAGIAFVNNNYPFSSAYDMAEELCKNAKKTALVRFGDDPTHPVSSIDFHVCSGELITDIANYRKQYLTQHTASADESVELCIRPYHVGDDKTVPDGLQFGSFLNRVRDLRKHSSDDEATDGAEVWIARSKLKGLRDKYGEGMEQAKRYGELMVERDVAIRTAAGNADQDRKDFIEDFKDPYVSFGTDPKGNQHARFFDALDVLDLCDDMDDVI